MLVPSSNFIPHAPSSVDPVSRTIAKVNPGIFPASTIPWTAFTKSGVRIVFSVGDGPAEEDHCHLPAVAHVALRRRRMIVRREESHGTNWRRWLGLRVHSTTYRSAATPHVSKTPTAGVGSAVVFYLMALVWDTDHLHEARPPKET
jgi:hypothetical protein